MGDAASTEGGDKAGIEFGNCCSALVSWMLLVWMFVSPYDDEMEESEGVREVRAGAVCEMGGRWGRYGGQSSRRANNNHKQLYSYNPDITSFLPNMFIHTLS